MPPRRAACGTYGAYRRHLKFGEPIDKACRTAQKSHDGTRSNSAPARSARAATKKAAAAAPPPPPPMVLTAEGHVSRLDVLKELLEEQRQLMPLLRVSDPARAYLLMREQRETVREIADIQGNGQAKGVTLEDQLAAARTARAARATGT